MLDLRRRSHKGKYKVMKSRNFVAKHAGKFNRAATFRDRTKYQRSPKHKNLSDRG